jgi:regulator of RNase E activity RraA
VEFGSPVEIGGLRVSTGDLLHGDLHGVHMIPRQIACELPRVAEQVLVQERELFELCDKKNFSIDLLMAKLEEQRAAHKL